MLKRSLARVSFPCPLPLLGILRSGQVQEVSRSQHVNMSILKLVTTPRTKGTNVTQHAKIKLLRPGLFWRSNWTHPEAAPNDQYTHLGPRLEGIAGDSVPDYIWDGGSMSFNQTMQLNFNQTMQITQCKCRSPNADHSMQCRTLSINQVWVGGTQTQ